MNGLCAPSIGAVCESKKINAEKIILLQGIQQLIQKMADDEPTLDLLDRYSNLVACLIDLNWKECGKREGEKFHTK